MEENGYKTLHRQVGHMLGAFESCRRCGAPSTVPPCLRELWGDLWSRMGAERTLLTLIQ